MSQLRGFGEMVRKIYLSPTFRLETCFDLVQDKSSSGFNGISPPTFQLWTPPPSLICNGLSSPTFHWWTPDYPRVEWLAGYEYRSLIAVLLFFILASKSDCKNIYFSFLTWRVFPLYQCCWYLCWKSVTRRPWSQRHWKHWIEWMEVVVFCCCK